MWRLSFIMCQRSFQLDVRVTEFHLQVVQFCFRVVEFIPRVVEFRLQGRSVPKLCAIHLFFRSLHGKLRTSEIWRKTNDLYYQ